MEVTPDVLDRAHAWMADDPDPDARDELHELIEQAAGEQAPDEQAPDEQVAAALAELEDRFRGLLQFGTAGLRGALGAGPNRMNRAVVIRAARGLATYLHTERTPTDRRTHHVVVGYDARYGSQQFALDTAAVIVGAGLRASLLPRELPTPVLAFAVRYLDADAGVMVTASHNPARDNGYKVYLGGPDNGAQLVPPADQQIAAAIAEVTSAAAVPRAEHGWDTLDEGLVVSYLQSVARLVSPEGCRALRIVLTSLHGVGGRIAMRALQDAGFTDLHPVPAQAEPDPDFPTVTFPNPEEPGALDLAVDLARTVRADLVLAHDPDADRCAAAVPTDDGSWRMLRGDEVGVLLGDHRARRGPAGTLASTIVSSRMLGAVAAAHGRHHVETLTGFKWISRTPDLAYGYEEAMGYCLDPTSVRDKDGISAALVLAELAAALNAHGLTLQDRLDDLATQHGVYLTDQISTRVDDLSVITRTMERLRRDAPSVLAGSPVARVDDLNAADAELPPTDAVRWMTESDVRVVVRPSGTEPKLKSYLEIVRPLGPGSSRADVKEARASAQQHLDDLRQEVHSLLEARAAP